MIACGRRGRRCGSWVAVPPREGGYAGFPLSDAGDVRPRSGAALSAGGLWALLTLAIRPRVDLDYLARRWHTAGIGELQRRSVAFL